MGLAKYLKETYKKPKKSLGSIYQQRLQDWRREPTTTRVDHPTRLDRARALGYKAKQGVFVVRQRVPRGGHFRSRKGLKRKPSRMSIRIPLAINYRRIAEMRADKKFPNCEVLNSYWVARDGQFYWYEVIMVEPNHPAIKKDKQLSWMQHHRHRAQRGLTSASRKGRGLYNKGKGAEKVRPSQAANKNRLK